MSTYYRRKRRFIKEQPYILPTILLISQDVHYTMLLYHFDLCPLSAFNYRSPNLDCGFVNKVWPVEGLQ